MTLKVLATVLFGVSIAIANVSAAKLTWFEFPFVGGVAVPAGFVAIGVAFLCSDLLVEFEGREYAHKVVNATVVAMIAGYALIWLAILMPVAPFYEMQPQYEAILGSSAAIVAASVITLTVSQHVDVLTFDFIKRATGKRLKFVRNVGSTAVSQAVDTVVFITLAFAIFPILQGTPAMTGMELVLIIVGQYIAKLFISAVDTPIFYVVTWIEERRRGQEVVTL